MTKFRVECPKLMYSALFFFCLQGQDMKSTTNWFISNCSIGGAEQPILQLLDLTSDVYNNLNPSLSCIC